MKYQQLKKRLLTESGIIAGGLVVMAAAAFFLENFSEDYQKSSDDLESKVQTITESTNTLNNQYDNVQHNGALLEKIVKLQSQNELSISPQVAKASFNHLRDRYYLSNLHLSMSPIVEMQDPNYKRVSSVIVSSEVSIDFEGLSDEYAYSLLNTLQQDLPGSSKIVELTLTREGNVTSDILRTISEKGSAQLIKGSIRFMWLGIKPVETSDTANAPKKP